MTDKDREAFEALFGKRDKYFSTNVIWDSAWKAWQAATAAALLTWCLGDHAA